MSGVDFDPIGSLMEVSTPQESGVGKAVTCFVYMTQSNDYWVKDTFGSNSVNRKETSNACMSGQYPISGWQG